jgi:hypothetical protein
VDLESFVTPQQFPDVLDASDARALVAAKVDECIDSYRAEKARIKAGTARRHELEQQQAARREEARNLQARKEGLIARGKSHAEMETLLWSSEERDRAIREVVRELQAEAEHDWTEKEVEEFVEDALDNWCDPEDEGDEDEDDRRDDFWDDEDEEGDDEDDQGG